MSLKTPLMICTVNHKSNKKAIFNWVDQFIQTDYPNRLIALQTYEVVTRAVELGYKLPDKYRYLINARYFKNKTLKRQRGLAREAV